MPMKTETAKAMEFRRIGNSGLTVSEISFGNWITHGAQINEADAIASVHAALDAGITSFDTADVYGATKAEVVLGRALQGVRREGIVLSSKTYWPTGPLLTDRGLSRKHIMESIHASLRRLQTDYIDVYYAHRYDDATPLEETMLALADIVRQGKALYIGISEWRPEQIREGYELSRELRIPLISNQPQHSMLWRVAETEIIPTCTELGIGQIGWSPLAQGVLTGKYQPNVPPPPGTRGALGAGSFRIDAFMTAEILQRVQQLETLASEAEITLAQMAIAWVLQNPAFASVVIGASCAAQVASNAQASGVILEPALLERIDEILDPVVERSPDRVAAIVK
jgi:aryl-alcohol dehydrogenase-like predicted oxidoreductase